MYISLYGLPSVLLTTKSLKRLLKKKNSLNNFIRYFLWPLPTHSKVFFKLISTVSNDFPQFSIFIHVIIRATELRNRQWDEKYGEKMERLVIRKRIISNKQWACKGRSNEEKASIPEFVGWQWKTSFIPFLPSSSFFLQHHNFMFYAFFFKKKNVLASKRNGITFLPPSLYFSISIPSLARVFFSLFQERN